MQDLTSLKDQAYGDAVHRFLDWVSTVRASDPASGPEDLMLTWVDEEGDLQGTAPRERLQQQVRSPLVRAIPPADRHLVGTGADEPHDTAWRVGLTPDLPAFTARFSCIVMVLLRPAYRVPCGVLLQRWGGCLRRGGSLFFLSRGELSTDTVTPEPQDDAPLTHRQLMALPELTLHAVDEAWAVGGAAAHRLHFLYGHLRRDAPARDA